MARFTEIKSTNSKSKQSELVKKLACSPSTLEQDRPDINILSPYRIPSNTHQKRQRNPNKNLNDDSQRKRDLEKPQMTSNDLKMSSKGPITNRRN